MFKRMIRQPLLHFLVLGGALFLAYGMVNPDQPGSRDTREVVVDRDHLLTYLQYRTKKFNPASAQEMLEGLAEKDLAALVDTYVREEVLYREALALKLDQDDYVIRRRLTQKLEFITKGFMDAAPDPSEEQLRTYLAEHQAEYYVEPHITFTHVFFGAEQRGWAEARAAAQDKLGELSRDGVRFADAVNHGDRFLYHLNYVERVPDYVASHFGEDMASALFSLDPSNSGWHGPYESGYGVHLVLVAERGEERHPELAEIRGRVLTDARSEMVRNHVEDAIGTIIDGYDVKVLYQPEEQTPSATVGTGSTPSDRPVGDS